MQTPPPSPSQTAAKTSSASGDTGAFARQEIVDLKGDVFGYELFDRSVTRQLHTPSSDAELLFNVLSHAVHEDLVNRKLLFINCTHDSLAGGHLDLINPEKVILEIPAIEDDNLDGIEDRQQILQEIRARGFRLAFKDIVLKDCYKSWLPLASFIKFDMGSVPADQIEPLIILAQTRSQAQLIAEKVETADQFALLRGFGIKLFQGYWFAKPVVVVGKTIRPSQANIIQLINLVRQQASTAEIEEVLKRDPTLSFNLLRFINSSGFGMSREITSFRHAVMILGLKKLFRWAVLLMTTSRGDGAPAAIGNTAVVRGRLMELLAAELLPSQDCDDAFVAGVFSLLDVMLSVPLDSALSAISLPQPVVEVLLHRTGPLAPFLDLAEACESANDTAFERAANTLQLSNHQVNLAHLHALAWADSLTA
ncbi:MAG: hypothetical protein RIS34_653 [Pseudomonadota bacterium]|jgi:EAL and modified HD-GYP domain-containing signal transduction protein